MSQPQIIVQQAEEAAAANLPANSARRGDEERRRHAPDLHDASLGLDETSVPPPPYGSPSYGLMNLDHQGLETTARVEDDGRVNIKINQKTRKLSNILVPALRHQLEIHKAGTKKAEFPIPPGLGGDQLPIPSMNIVIQIVGSRGDVQPYVALGLVLKKKFGHRVRIATHPVFKDFVTENNLEFFSIGGDPAELMAFMVKNPGLMPGKDALRSGDIGQRRKAIYEMITGCWRSCIEPGDGFGEPGYKSPPPDLGNRVQTESQSSSSPRPFVADAIIANPPSFAHIHIAEKLGVPLHLTFTMPWSPTQSFPHPLANIVSSNAESSMTNFLSYSVVDMMTWQGLGDLINRFREKTLGLEPVSLMWAPGMLGRLKIPYTYCWSAALIPKPKDWAPHLDISGFYFLDLASNYTPAPDLKAFLDGGPPPVYIGFGSIVVDDPNAMTDMIFEAVRKTGQRALVSKGWGGLGADDLGIPEGVFMLGNVPHDWLFERVSCVVHHGGAGTTSAGIRAGRPTVIVPFFGDQPFWGSMVARAGAGPPPIPYKELTADKLAASIMHAIRPESLERAAEMKAQIQHENGTETGATQFHNQLKMETLRCSLAPDRMAAWRIKRTNVRLSTFAATVLANEELIEFSDLELHRSCEYAVEDGPTDPITGGASALIGTLGNLSMGVADLPVDVLRSLKLAPGEKKENASSSQASDAGTITPSTSSIALQSSTAKTGTETPCSGTSTAITSDYGAFTPSQPLSPRSEAGDLGDSKQLVTEQPNASIPEYTSPPRSRSRSPFGEAQESGREKPNQWTIASVMGAGKGVSRMVGEGLKSPMDFTMGLAKGFHNAPKLYGDDTVRQSEKVTDLKSGLRAAGREFTYGFYDGISGLATHPIRGVQEEGPAGFFKGVAKGIGGLVLKPAAGVYGLPGYTFKGIYAELLKSYGASAQNYIIAARVAQGYEDCQKSTPEQRANIVAVWKGAQVELEKGGKKYNKEKSQISEQHLSQDNLPQGFSQTRHLSWDERKKLAEERQRRKKESKHGPDPGSKEKTKSICRYCSFEHGQDVEHKFAFPEPAGADPEIQDYETAIQRSVQATSTGDPEEDQMIARALRASVAELQAAQQAGDHDSAYDRAVAASVAEANRARAETHTPRKVRSGC